MGKYQHLTDFQIDEKINSGEFREEGILVRNVANGESVKVKSLGVPVTTNFPPIFVQIHNTYVYQADLGPVFEEWS